jgi:hypothetical protein
VKTITPIEATVIMEDRNTTHQLIFSSILETRAVSNNRSAMQRPSTVLYSHCGVEWMLSAVMSGYQGAYNEQPVMTRTVSNVPYPPHRCLPSACSSPETRIPTHPKEEQTMENAQSYSIGFYSEWPERDPQVQCFDKCKKPLLAIVFDEPADTFFVDPMVEANEPILFPIEDYGRAQLDRSLPVF